jgi:predicted nucleic acid-binding protein
MSTRARHDLTELRPVVDDEGPHLAFGETLELADKHALSVYDAAYLELALRKSLPLASRDEALNKAAARAGVKTVLD